jgi:hypothetical protein
MPLTCSVDLSPTRPIAYYEQFNARVYNVRTILWHKTMAFGVAVMPRRTGSRSRRSKDLGPRRCPALVPGSELLEARC